MMIILSTFDCALLLVLAASLSLTMVLAWWVAERTGVSSWIDAFWAGAVGLGGVSASLTGASLTPRSMLVALLVGFWSLRLTLFLIQRSRQGVDDPRYAWLRQEWGAGAGRRMLRFLQIQAAVAFLLVLAIMVAAENPAPWPGPGDGLGVALILVAIIGEACADRQMARFRADPARKGQICDTGLWGWSRHPNYFFEWLNWLAYPLIAIDPGEVYAWGWLALIGPVLMYVLLVHVSGIPPLEAHMLRRRGDAFRAYQARVSAFWPIPPADKEEQP